MTPPDRTHSDEDAVRLVADALRADDPESFDRKEWHRQGALDVARVAVAALRKAGRGPDLEMTARYFWMKAQRDEARSWVVKLQARIVALATHHDPEWGMCPTDPHKGWDCCCDEYGALWRDLMETDAAVAQARKEGRW